MSSFFHQQAQIMMSKHIDSYPLLKINRLLDWQPIEQLLNRQKTRYIRDHRGRPAYPLLPMLKAVLLGQWHSLSDPELERCLATRDLCKKLFNPELIDIADLINFRYKAASRRQYKYSQLK